MARSSGVELSGDSGLTLSQQLNGQAYDGAYGDGQGGSGAGGRQGGLSGGASVGAQEPIDGDMRMLLKPGGLVQLHQLPRRARCLPSA